MELEKKPHEICAQNELQDLSSNSHRDVQQKGAMPADGIHAMVLQERMCAGARKYRDFVNGVPGSPFFQREFSFSGLDRWHQEGLPEDVNLDEFFHFDPQGAYSIGQLGWTTAAFSPAFEEKVLEDRGECEVAQDAAGRHVLFFKGRRSGFMPEYLDHPVKNRKTWEENVKWRLDPMTAQRYADTAMQMQKAKEGAGQGMVMFQHVIGGFMYLRSLIGPLDLLYFVHDEPELLHDCMETWFKLADAVISRHQEQITFDVLFFGEDICYNHGALISPEMIRRYLFPYYQQLIANMKSRQIDKKRHLHFAVDTDGFASSVIPLYQDIGVDIMMPFEVASGCDVVEIGRQYPGLIMSGGFDKRILARDKETIDREVERIFPVMRARGGYLPTCDHGVPEEVSLENYLHYRKRCLEWAK